MKNLRKLIQESIAQVLSESMNMGINDHSYADDLDHILDMTHYIIKKVAYDLYPKLGLSDEEKETLGGLRYNFTPDGSDAFEPTGTINFYVRGFPDRTIDTIIGYIKYILAEKNITVGPVRKEMTSQKLSPEEMKEYGIEQDSLRVIQLLTKY